MPSGTPARQFDRSGARARIGADHARWWVRQITLGNPYAKAILMAVANYMNENGAAWPGLSTLASDTDISEDTVASRLRWCESIGAIVMLKVWVDENGRRNYEKRGRPTSSEIRFLFDADIEAVEAAADAASGPKPLRGAALKAHENRAAEAPEQRPSDSEESEFSDRPRRGLTEDALHPVSTQVAPEQPPPPAARIEELEDKKDSPLPPKGGQDSEIVEQENNEASPLPGSDTWPDFEKAYSEPILRQSIARQVWSALTPDERNLAIKAARGYVAYRKAQKKPPNVLNAHTFLRERDAWAEFAKLAPQEPVPKVFIEEQSPDFEALRVLALIRGTPAPAARVEVELSSKGIWRLGHVPPDLAALSRFVGNPIEQWNHVEQNTKAYFAWCERIQKWTGHRPEPQRIETGGEKPFEWNGKTTMVKNFVMGLRVPCTFPPRKDGTIPPESLTDAEAKEFADTG